MILYLYMIRQDLADLANASYQWRVWTGRDPDMMDSLVERVESLFTDSGLGEALESGAVFGDPIDSAFRTLGSVVDRLMELEDHRPIEEVLAMPEAERCRRIAQSLLEMLPAEASIIVIPKRRR